MERKPEIIIGALFATAGWAIVAIFLHGLPDSTKDYAGPGATVIAASVAGWVAFALGRGQLSVARSQAEIARQNWQTANERVVLDLIERRIVIYEAIRKVVAKVMTTGQPLHPEHFEYAEAIDRAPFYFGPEVDEYLKRIRIVIIDLEYSNTLIAMNDPSGPKLHCDRMTELDDFYRTAPRLFGPYIRAHQKV